MKIIKILYFSLLFGFYSCGSSDRVDRSNAKVMYRAINKADTATLNVILNDKEFYGQYEINYRGAFKDSGDVTGIVKGDTLKGTYRFQHYGIEKWHKVPIALLKRDNKLVMGQGDMEIYMNMYYFKKNAPIDYKNAKFVFEKVD